MRIGFIGLGNMGAPMAVNLVAAGHTLTGYDPVAAIPDGVIVANSSAAAATDQDVVITMLPDGQILRTVAAEITPAMDANSVYIDCSTVDVSCAQAVAADAIAAGLRTLDAPVSGGVTGASAGTLTFMVGGDEATFQTVQPLFDTMGQKAVHCGQSGNGQAAKICNNMICGVAMAATSEAFVLADKLGLDREKMFDVVSTSSGSTWVLTNYCPAPGIGKQSPADNDYKPGFSTNLMLKDLRLSQQAAESVDADTPMGRTATRQFAEFVEQEDGSGLDMSAILMRYEKRGRSD